MLAQRGFYQWFGTDEDGACTFGVVSEELDAQGADRVRTRTAGALYGDLYLLRDKTNVFDN